MTLLVTVQFEIVYRSSDSCGGTNEATRGYFDWRDSVDWLCR